MPVLPADAVFARPRVVFLATDATDSYADFRRLFPHGEFDYPAGTTAIDLIGSVAGELF